MALGYQPDDKALAGMVGAMGVAPSTPEDDAAHEREVLASNTGPLVPLPGGGALGDLPPGVGTRALTFQVPTQPPPVDPMGAPLPQASPPLAPPSAQPVGAAPRPAAPNAEAQAVAAEGRAAETQAQSKEREGAAEQSVQDANAAGLNAKAAKRDEQVGEYQAAQLAAQRAHSDAVAEAESAADEYKNFKFQDYWSGRNTAMQRSLHTTGGKIIAILGSFLGGMTVPRGGVDAVGERIKQETDRNFEQQKLKLQSKEQFAQWKRQGVKDVDAYQQDQLQRLQIKQGMALQSVADRTEALAATATGKLKAVEAKTLADGLRTQGAQMVTAGQHGLIQSNLARAETAKNYAEATKAKAEAKAAGVKAGATDDEIFYDKQGNAVGLVAKGRGGAQAFATRDANFQDALDKMQAYRDFIAKIGGRPKSVADIKQARVLYKSAGLAVGAVSPNGTTKEAQENEAATLGPDPSSISGWLQGPMSAAVDQKIAQVQTLKKDYQTQMLRPLNARQSGTVSAVPQPSRDVSSGPPPGAIVGSMNGKRGYVLNGQFTAM